MTSAPISFLRGADVTLYLSPAVGREEETLAFGTSDLVGNVGGYLGLFLGWSVLSISGGIVDRAAKIKLQ